ATERAQLRTETLSCVREDGRVIEAELEGYAVGEDGKVGMRGRLVSK
ncbi:conjugal transfer protein TraB, partial [bacterium CG17_big_fil_post_rev_8_21_14_2_50_64_8]